MASYQCAECGETNVERDYDVMAVEIKCPNEECGEFCPHVNLDNHRVRRIIEENDLEESAKAIAKALRGGL